MTLAFDNFAQSDASGTGGGTPSVSLLNAGDILLAACFLDSAGETITAVGYNGVALTQLYQHKTDSCNLYVGYLLLPDKGTFNVNFNFSGSVSVFRCAAISFNNILQTSPTGGTASLASQNSNATPNSVTPTAQGAAGIIVDFFFGTATASGSANATQTEKMNNTGSWSGGANHLAGISYFAHTGGKTMTWESLTFDSGTADQEHYAVELLPGLFVPQIHIL